MNRINQAKPYPRLPPCVQDYLLEEHMARFVVDIVDQLDLRILSAAYAGKGKSIPLSSGDVISVVILRLRDRRRVFQS